MAKSVDLTKSEVAAKNRLTRARIARMYLRCCLGVAAVGCVALAIYAVFASVTVGWWLWNAAAMVGSHFLWFLIPALVVGCVFFCHFVRLDILDTENKRAAAADVDTTLLCERWKSFDGWVAVAAFVATGVFIIMGTIWSCRSTVSSFNLRTLNPIANDWSAVGGGAATADKAAKFDAVIQRDLNTRLTSDAFSFRPGVGLVVRLTLNHETCLRAAAVAWLTPIDADGGAVPVSKACELALFNSGTWRIDGARVEAVAFGKAAGVDAAKVSNNQVLSIRWRR